MPRPIYLQGGDVSAIVTALDERDAQIMRALKSAEEAFWPWDRWLVRRRLQRLADAGASIRKALEGAR